MVSARLQRPIHFAIALGIFAFILAPPGSHAWGQRVIDPNCGGVWSICAADLDGDGNQDLVAAPSGGSAMYWWENDGHLNFTRHTLATNAALSSAICAGDLDGDGDQDVAVVSAYSGHDFGLAWWENRGAGQFLRHVLDVATVSSSGTVAADLDGDGDQDLAVASEVNGVAWWRNNGDGTFERIDLGGSGYDIAAIDREGDGDIDLVSAYGNSKPIWWINDGHGTFTLNRFHWDSPGGTTVCAADLNGDHEAEAILSSQYDGAGIGWVERVGDGYVEHRLSPFDEARDCWAGDLDCDGDNDIVGISDPEGVHWWENLGGGQFLDHGLLTSGVFWCVTGADLDGDGDTELIAGSNGVLYCWPNQWKSPGPAPALTNVAETGGGKLSLQWTNANDMPAHFLGIAYDYYAQQWATVPGDASPWHSFWPTASAGQMPLGQAGGYGVWLGSQFFFNELLLSPNPWSGILYDAVPHQPLMFQATASEIVGWPFGRQVDLKWRSDIYGTWQYQLIAYKLDEGWVQTYSLPDGKAFWHAATYPDSSHLNGQTRLFLPPGNYWIYLRAIGWISPYPASSFATAFVSVPGA